MQSSQIQISRQKVSNMTGSIKEQLQGAMYERARVASAILTGS